MWLKGVRTCLPLATMAGLLLASPALKAQKNPNPNGSYAYGSTSPVISEDKGPTASETLTADSNSISGVLQMDS